MSTEIIFQHGWAFDSTAWNGWRAALNTSRPDVTCLIGERGYFGLPKLAPQFSNRATQKILMTHSLGLHLIGDELLANCDELYILNGFLHFHPTNQTSKKRSQRVLRMMTEKMTTDPESVLNDFWRNCYSPWIGSTPLVRPVGFETNLLVEDLQILDKHTVDVDALQQITTVVLLSAGADQVVRRETAAELAEAIPSAVSITVPHVSHAFPLTHVETCVQFLNQCSARKHRESCHQ